jgi:hypothetical protein
MSFCCIPNLVTGVKNVTCIKKESNLNVLALMKVNDCYSMVTNTDKREVWFQAVDNKFSSTLFSITPPPQVKNSENYI